MESVEREDFSWLEFLLRTACKFAIFFELRDFNSFTLFALGLKLKFVLSKKV